LPFYALEPQDQGLLILRAMQMVHRIVLLKALLHDPAIRRR